ncbi:MAG: hypothetical protein GXP29_00095 [Planctomycetes bacterium]|nr:hypothetical protein [Planctomycetota bacterium]
MALSIVLSNAGARAEIIGDIVRVGYPIASESGSAVRHGAWIPVVVDLRLENQTSFDGVLRLRQYDRDGDVYVDSIPVHLFADGGGQKRYWLYTVMSRASNDNERIHVELFATEGDDEDDSGKLVKVISGGAKVSAMVPPIEPEFISDDHLIILEVSDRSMGKIRALRHSDHYDTFDRRIRLAHLAPSDLPPKWFGLDAVDVVVWDEADTTSLTNEQELALVEWVQHGGTLLLAAARTASTLAQSTYIGPLLPVKIGPVEPKTRLPAVQAELMEIDGDRDAYQQPVTVAKCTAIDDPKVVTMLTESAVDGAILVKRRVDRGQIIFLSVALRDVLGNADVRTIDFFMRVLELRRNPVSSEVGDNYVSLFRDIDGVVGFHGVSGFRLTAAILFCMTYVLLATFGVWKLLQSRNLLKHSWTALAVVGAGASVVSIIGVQSVHGIGSTLHQLTIVDGSANSARATGTAYFGLTTSTKSILDVWLPSDALLDEEPGPSGCVLQPMLDRQNSNADSVSFTDPERYRIRPATAEVCGVPLRATLKQFEGRWKGTLSGTVSSSLISVERQMPTGDAKKPQSKERILSEGSWIKNNMGVDLNKCYLIFAPRDLYAPEDFFNPTQQRASIDELRAIPLGTIADGQRIDLYARLYQDKIGTPLTQQNRAARSLKSTQTRWGRHLASAAERENFGRETVRERFDLNWYENAVLLSTVLADINPEAFRSSVMGGYPLFSRERTRQLDMSHLLTSRSAILVGFSDEVGPVRLSTRSGSNRPYETIMPKKAWTVYRIVLPVENR